MMPDITAKLAAHRDEMYRDVATMFDVDAKRLSRESDDLAGYPLPISGDALAIYKATH